MSTTGKWQKSSPELAARFEAALPTDARAERRKMFGYPCSFANGHLYAGLHQQNVIVRLGGDVRARFEAAHGKRPFEPMPGRSMKDFVVLTDADAADAARMRPWISEAFAQALALAPKPAKGAKAAKPAKAMASKAPKARGAKPAAKPAKPAAKRSARA